VSPSLGLMYQTRDASAWRTVALPHFFTKPLAPTRVTVLHAGDAVSVYRDGVPFSKQAGFSRLDYSGAKELALGGRPGTTAQSWRGTVSNASLAVGAVVPSPDPDPVRSNLPAAEIAALRELWSRLGGARWKYKGTDVYSGGGAQGNGGGRWLEGDPCGRGGGRSWYGVQCDAAGAHVTGLFPNTRGSGNPLVGRVAHCRPRGGGAAARRTQCLVCALVLLRLPMAAAASFELVPSCAKRSLASAAALAASGALTLLSFLLLSLPPPRFPISQPPAFSTPLCPVTPPSPPRRWASCPSAWPT
jgi:hypothetical protein